MTSKKLLDSTEIAQIESRFISLFERTIKKGFNVSGPKLKTSIKKQFKTATFQKQIDTILNDVVLYTVDYTDKELSKLLKASISSRNSGLKLIASREVLPLTEEAVRQSTELSELISESIIRTLKDEAIYQEGPATLARRVQDLWGGQKYRAERFARTFSADVATSTALNRYQNNGIEDIQFYATIDERTSPQCRALNGTIFKSNSPEAKRYSCPLHHNCFIEGTRFELTGDLVAAFRGWYDGEVIELTLSNGSRLTVTPNHMLLTPHGFLAAEFAANGDDVICSSTFQRDRLPIHPDNDNIYPRVEEIFSTLGISGSMFSVCMPASPIDLHNDGKFIQGNIDIIFPKCLLKSTRESSFSKHVCEDLLRSTNECLSTFPRSGDLLHVLFSMAFSTDGGMSGSRQTDSFFGGRLGHSGIHCVASSSNSDTVFDQSGFYYSSIAPEMFTKCFDGNAGVIEPDELVCINVNSLDFSSFLSIPNDNSHFFESVNYSIGLYTESLSELCRRYSGLVELCKVIKVNVVPYHGYVYDFQTLSTLCIGNGVVTSNCRSCWIPVPLTMKIDDSLRYENRNFSKPVGQDLKPLKDGIDSKVIKQVFKDIDKFKDNYAIDKFILEEDIEKRLIKLGVVISN